MTTANGSVQPKMPPEISGVIAELEAQRDGAMRRALMLAAENASLRERLAAMEAASGARPGKAVPPVNASNDNDAAKDDDDVIAQ